MKKTKLKLFLYSFIVSLFTIFVSEKFYARHIETASLQNNLKAKNGISLFVSTNNPIEIPTGLEHIEVSTSTLGDIDYINTDIENIRSYTNISRSSKGNEDFAKFNMDESNLSKILISSAYNDIDAFSLAESIAKENQIKLEVSKKDIESISNTSTTNVDIIRDELKVESKYIKNITSLEKTNPIKEEKVDVVVNTHSEEIILDDFIPILWSKNNTTNKHKTKIAEKADTNSVALAESSIPLNSLIEDKTTEIAKNEEKDKSPWVVAKGAKIINNKFAGTGAELNVKANIDNSRKVKTVQAQIADNILIPIPEEILKEGDVTPQLISSSKNKELKEKVDAQIIEKKTAVKKTYEPIEEKATGTEDKAKEKKNKLSSKAESTVKKEKQKENNNIDYTKENLKTYSTPKETKKTTEKEKKDKKTIFDSITNIFTSTIKAPEVGVSKIGKDDEKSDYFTKLSSKQKKEKVTKILPTEIKLSFRPNRAEISGMTLRWLEAFANATKEDDTIVLEVRINGNSSFELQKKRFELLHNILTNKGVEYNKINTVFTNREANSFIIRTVKIDKPTNKSSVNNKVVNKPQFYQDW